MKKSHLAEIRRIQESIPKHLIDNLTYKEKVFPTIKEVAERALLEPDDKVTPEEKSKYKAMLDSGYLDTEQEVINRTIEQQVDDYLNKEFEKARKLGRLPPPQKWPKLRKKAKHYAKSDRDIEGVVSEQETSLNQQSSS